MKDAPESIEGWVSISELARLRGVDKAAISRRVARLEVQGLLRTQRGKQGTKLVPLALFDKVCSEVTDAIRQANGAPASAASTDPILSREQARRAGYDADLKKLDLDERLGRLVAVDKVNEGMTECGQRMARIIDQMPTRAEEVASAIAKDGVQGARAILKTLAREIRDELARAMSIQGDDDEGLKGPPDDEGEDAGLQS